ncbi:CpaF family protein [Aquipuribacter sp. SD81]|uniref:CpaF family protein n=1 Tax=Aquipuribacter sp. SD81 TaxID=3127703 RepID=UPI00301A67C6
MTSIPDLPLFDDLHDHGRGQPEREAVDPYEQRERSRREEQATRSVPPTTRADADPFGPRRRQRQGGFLRGLAGPSRPGATAEGARGARRAQPHGWVPAAVDDEVVEQDTRLVGQAGGLAATGAERVPVTVEADLASEGRRATSPSATDVASPAPDVPSAPTGADDAPGWDVVRELREQASTRLAARLRAESGLGAEDRRALGRAVVEELLTERDRAATFDGRRASTPEQRRALAKALDDALFGLGRLQPLVDDPGIENIEITGHDRVVVERVGGVLEKVPAVADSDAELVDYLQFLASRASESNDRPFSSAHPRLHLNLPGSRARLAAIGWVTPRPVVRIRMHRLTDVTLDDLVALRTVDERLASFLSAAVRARKSVVVSGDMGAGKTTMLRALARTIDPAEAIATLETEYELFLHEMPGYERVVALEGRPGSGERGPDGRPLGEITVEDLFVDVLRLNVSRIIVGEVRGPEAAAMFKAMQAGAGSLSTVHAKNAADTIERLTLAVHSAGGTESYADRLVAQQIDYVVHMASVRDHDGTRARVVDEVMEVTRGEGGRPATTLVFGPGSDRRAVPRVPPSGLADLEAVGFDGSLLDTAWDDEAGLGGVAYR